MSLFRVILLIFLFPFSSNALDYYWVAGNGNWSDLSHWATTSGGAIKHTQMPTASDDVFFDANSGLTNATVVLNSNDAFCKNMAWIGTPLGATLKGDTLRNLHIFSSLAFNSTMNFDFKGFTYFESDATGNAITSAGKVFKRDVFFVGKGDWTLQDSLSTRSALILKQGTLKTNNQRVFAQRFESKSTSIRKLELGSSRLEFTNYFYTGTYNVDGKGLQIDAGTSTIVLSASSGANLNHYFTSADTLHYHNVEFKNGYSSIYSSGAKLSFNKIIFNANSTITDFPLTIDTLVYGARTTNLLQGGFSQKYVMQIRVKALIINGDCDKGFTTIRKSATTKSAFFSSSENINVQNLMLIDVGAAGTGTFTANNSIGDGVTTKWIVNQSIPRTLYWVGNGGFWKERTHWSLASGGAGGECVPTPVDDVIFDQNSFFLAGQLVSLDNNNNTCRNLDFSAVSNKPQLSAGTLHIYGNLKHAPKANMPRSFITYNFYGGKKHTIESQGQHLFGIYFLGRGTYSLKDSLFADFGNLQKGHFDANSQKANFDYFSIENSQDTITFSIDSSHFFIRNINGSFYPFYANTKKLVVNADKSLLEMGGKEARMYITNKFFTRFNTILFSNPAGKGTITKIDSFDISYSKLLFYGNGTLIGTHQADSLIGSPGRTYAFENAKTQKVTQYLHILGNVCQSIQLISTLNKQKANLIMPASAKIVADFVQMQDQNASGGATFDAGSHSTDVGQSNTGWTFPTPTIGKNDGFLGRDTAFCNAKDSIILTAYNNVITKDITFKWQDGTTKSTLVAAKTGLYHVTVTFGNNCKITDSINIFSIQQSNLDLGKDTSLCEGLSLMLNADINNASAKYFWQDSTTNSSLNISKSGFYKVEINILGCKTKDSINIVFLPKPSVELGKDTSLCENQTLILKASAQNIDSYLWQNGSTDVSLEVKSDGSYSVSVSKDGCMDADTVKISFNPIPTVDLGKDTLLCESKAISLNAENNGAQFLWSDNSTTQVLTISTSGTYAVTVSKGACRNQDSIKVIFQNLPKFNLGKDTTLCSGKNLVLNGGKPNLLWQDGTTAATFEVSKNGLYFAKANENGCSFSDSITIILGQPFKINLGRDTLVCDDVSLNLGTNISDAKYLWSNDEKTPQIAVRQQDTYWLRVEKEGCAATDTVIIDYKKCTSFQYFAPSAFSPNDDGYNDEWQIFVNPDYPVLDFTLQIFDRWGNIAFESKDPAVGWTGFYKNNNDATQKASTGVYSYRLNLVYRNEDLKRDKTVNGGGEIFLIR